MNKCFCSLIFVLSFSILVFSQSREIIDVDQSYLLISTKRIQTMEKELDEAAAKGFRVLYSAPTEQFDMSILLKRVENPKSESFTYKVLATSRISTMENELNALAKQGFQLLPRTIILKRGLFTAELVMLMERAPDSNKTYEYKLVVGRTEVKIHKDIDEVGVKGFVPVTMVIYGKNVVVMEKPAT